MIVRAVAEDQWTIVDWLWQAFRNDLSVAVHGFPYADGRYARAQLDDYPAPDRTGYLAWEPHPNTGEDAPVGFALVDGSEDVRMLAAFFVVPAARRTGVGRRFASDVIARHPGAWRIGFQHDNPAAGAFWRAVADDCFEAWSEEQLPVPGKPEVPPDHWITSSAGRPGA